MISNFALLLSHEGITLAHRTPEGWAELGQVNLLDEDLPTKLEALRKQGEALAVKDFSTKIVLPNDQIKYLTLPSVDDETREDAIKEALENATPYLIDDLVYDWEDGEDGMNIAAVARDTLDEAESFITQYGFNPTSFVSAPDDALFSVEPFFGACANAALDLDIADNIEAEVDKVILTFSDEAPMTEAVEILDVDEEEGEPQADDIINIAVDDPDADPEANAEDDDDQELIAPEVPEEPRKDEDKSSFPFAPLVAERDDDNTHLNFPSLGPATETSILRGMEPAIKPAPRIGMGAEDDDDVKDRSLPSWASGASRSASTDKDENVETQNIDWLKRQKSSDDDETTAPPSWMKTDDQADALDDASEFEEDQEAAAWVPTTSAAPIQQPLYDEAQTEAEKLEIFGNRGDKNERDRGFSPIWIGGIALFLILLIAGSFFGFRYLSDSPTEQAEADEIAQPLESEPTEETQASEADEAPALETSTIESASDVQIPSETDLETAQDTGLEAPADLVPHQGVDQPEDSPVLPEDEIAVQAEVETAAALQEPEQEAQETVAPQDQILSEAPSASEIAPTRPQSDETEAVAEVVEAEATEAESVEVPAEEQAETTAETETAILSTSETEWGQLSPEARDARYAATGIWPMAPDAPVAPIGENVGALFLANVDPVVFATDAYAITSEAELLSDKALTAVPNPPAPGTRFERDERGLVLATPEGALTPDGITVYSGIPPLLPPLAPRPDPIAQQEEQRAALEGKIPQLRPDLEVEAESEPEAAEDIAPTPSTRPPLRPAEVAALANRPVEPVNPLALRETPMPRLRPSNIGEIIYNTERATVAAQTTTAVAPSNATVGSQATEENALSLRGVNLIGIYGEAGDRRALVRLASGRYTKIEVGDRLNGGQVSAIDKDRVLYIRNGQTVVLRMPSP